ncbi:MAG: hypothetical protein ACREHG_08535, partial [Candidatus Saccharimonadales bacterium]
MDQSMEESRARFAHYWGQRITAWNPDQLRLPDARNPASLAPLDVANTPEQFTAFINRLQLHTACRLSYCLRLKKGSDVPKCRFFFPRPLFNEPTVTKDINHKDWMFSPARNQATLNQCSPVITMGWMANTDIQPSTSLYAVLTYLGKYVSKPEKSSISYTELQAQVLPHVSSRAPLLSFASKMLNKLIAERDWSAQEVSHFLLNIPAQESSRQVITLDCRPEEVQNDVILVEEDTTTARRSALQRYQTRLTDAPGASTLTDITLFEWLRSWDWRLWQVRPRAAERVINYFPIYPSDPTLPTYLDYCRVRLMLHHPFTSFTDLLSFDGNTYPSYVEAFQACKQLHIHPEDFYTDLEAEGLDSDLEDESDNDLAQEDSDDRPIADFEAYARRNPRHDLPCISFTDELGLRDIDRAYDWSSHVGRYVITPEEW